MLKSPVIPGELFHQRYPHHPVHAARRARPPARSPRPSTVSCSRSGSPASSETLTGCCSTWRAWQSRPGSPARCSSRWPGRTAHTWPARRAAPARAARVLGVVHFGLNSGIVAIAISFERRAPVLPIWRELFGELWVSSLGGVFAAMLMLVLSRDNALETLILIAPLPVILHMTLRHVLRPGGGSDRSPGQDEQRLPRDDRGAGAGG